MNRKLLPYTLFICIGCILSPTLLFAEPSDTLRVSEMDEVIVVSTPKEHSLLRQQPLSSTSIGISPARSLAARMGFAANAAAILRCAAAEGFEKEISTWYGSGRTPRTSASTDDPSMEMERTCPDEA